MPPQPGPRQFRALEHPRHRDDDPLQAVGRRPPSVAAAAAEAAGSPYPGHRAPRPLLLHHVIHNLGALAAPVPDRRPRSALACARKGSGHRHGSPTRAAWCGASGDGARPVDCVRTFLTGLPFLVGHEAAGTGAGRVTGPQLRPCGVVAGVCVSDEKKCSTSTPLGDSFPAKGSGRGQAGAQSVTKPPIAAPRRPAAHRSRERRDTL